MLVAWAAHIALCSWFVLGGTKTLGTKESNGADEVTMCLAGPCSEHLIKLQMSLFIVRELKQVAFKGSFQSQ